MCLLRFFSFFIFSSLILLAQDNRTFQDVYGKTVVLPEAITRVYGSAPHVSYMLSVIDDTSLVGVCFAQRTPDNRDADKFLSEYFMQLPILGGWFGHGVPNIEAVLAKNPQVIVTWDTPFYNETLAKDLSHLSIPILKVNFDDTKNYPDTLRILGKILNKKERADALAQMAKTYVDEIETLVKNIPEKERVKVYYAEGDQGLQTECNISFHSEPLVFAGAKLVHKCVQKDIYGFQALSFRQIMLYDPDVIIVQSPIFYRNIFNDMQWAMLKAVKNRRVYLIPTTPFNWMDRPPSFMRIIGVHWIASKLYPDRYPFSLQEKVRAFFKLFFKVELNDEELKRYFDL